MQTSRLPVPVPVSVAAVAVSSCTTVVLYAVALRSFGSEGRIDDVVVQADQSVVVGAVVLSAVGVLLAALRRSRGVTGVLLAAAIATALVAGVTERLGDTLAHLQRAEQPRVLTALFDTMTGTGAALMPVPCILAAGALLAFVVARVGRARPGALQQEESTAAGRNRPVLPA